MAAPSYTLTLAGLTAYEAADAATGALRQLAAASSRYGGELRITLGLAPSADGPPLVADLVLPVGHEADPDRVASAAVERLAEALEGDRVTELEREVHDARTALSLARQRIEELEAREGAPPPAPLCDPCAAEACAGCAGDGCTCPHREERAPEADADGATRGPKPRPKGPREARPLPVDWRPLAPTMQGLAELNLDAEAALERFRAEVGSVPRKSWGRSTSKEFYRWARERRQALPQRGATAR
jgi:hypothetical protein